MQMDTREADMPALKHTDSGKYGYFRKMTDRQLAEVISAAPALLSDEARADLEKPFLQAVDMIAGDTLEAMAVSIIAKDNPLAAYDRRLCTEQQKKEAFRVLQAQLESGERSLPEELCKVLNARLCLLSDALSEMLRNIQDCKREISDILFGGAGFTRIMHIEAGAGDYHNYARAAAFIETDRGKMVYKPRSGITDVKTRLFVQKYFPGRAVVPKCYTDGSSFSVCEYIHASRADGAEEAEAWFYALGELTVLAQVLGSFDLHFENVTASGALPALIDTETILHSRMITDEEQSPDGKAAPGFRQHIPYSVWFSALLPHEENGSQMSVLMRTDGENACTPVVDGKPVTVLGYEDAYFSGLEEAYRRCLARKEELLRDVRALFSDVPVRVMLRSSQRYADLMKMMYSSTVLSSEKAYGMYSMQIGKALHSGLDEEIYGEACRSETEAVLRGDIPYFYTFGNSVDVFDANGSTGKLIRQSGVSESLERISRMSEEELLFEKSLILETLAAVPVRTGQQGAKIIRAKAGELPQRSNEALSPETAVREAGEIISTIRRRMIPAPGGCFGWADTSGKDFSPGILDPGMFTGTAGIGLLAAAAETVFTSGDDLESAAACREAAVKDAEMTMSQLRKMSRRNAPGFLSEYTGVSSGVAGLIHSLVLMDRYSGCGQYAGLVEEGLDILLQVDFSAASDTDRISGLAGITAVLCSFPELQRKPQVKQLTASLADRLLELKTFEADGAKLWKTISPRHHISGAGHGMAGIAEALCAAGTLLEDNRYMEAALEALSYEEQTYSSRLGSWPDNRTWPAQGIMHGFCSGAPGIGIMMERIRRECALSAEETPEIVAVREAAERCAALAEEAAEGLPLLYRDHLCCGNSAIAEYFLFIGEREKAGQVLNAMHKRRERTGVYTTLPPGYRSGEPGISLFYGTAGVAYEMLRYAFPDKIQSLFQ